MNIDCSVSLIGILNMTLTLVLFVVGMLGFCLNKRNLLILLISIELILLSVTLLFLTIANTYNDSTGHTYGIIIIAIAGSESAVGLGIIVAYYRLRGSLVLAQ